MLADFEFYKIIDQIILVSQKIKKFVKVFSFLFIFQLLDLKSNRNP